MSRTVRRAYSAIADPDKLTTTQVARLLGISPHTVIRCCDDGTLPYWRVPGSKHRRFRREVIERIKAEQDEAARG